MEVSSPLLKRTADTFRAVTTKRRGVALCLWGAAGIGKTHTAQKLLAALNCTTLAGHASRPVADLVRTLPRPAKLPLWAEHGLDRLARGEVYNVSQAAALLAVYLSASAPIVLYIEDLHDAPEVRFRLFSTLAERVKRSRGVGLLVTSRVAPPQPFEAVRLAPLSAEAARALLEAEVGAMLPAEACAWIFERAQGNPLFTLEYFRYLTRQGFLWNDARRWHWRTPLGALMPVTVEALIEQLVRHADTPSLATTLQARAVLPVATSEALWSKVAQLPPTELAGARAELERLGLLQETAFAHPLFREVTLSHLDPARRRELSRRALAALEASPQEAAAFIEGAELSDEEAERRLERAARAAREAGSELQALRFLARAVHYLSGAEEAHLALQIAQSLQDVDVAEAARLAELAAKDNACQLDAVRLWAELLAVQGELPKAEALLETLCGARQDLAWFASLLRLRGVAHQYHGVLELLEAHPELANDPSVAPWAARAFTHHGRLGEAKVTVTNAEAQAPLSDEARADLLRASSLIAYTQADFAEMERLERELYDLGLARGSLRLVDQALFNRALALQHLGHYRERLASLEAAMRVCRELGDTSAYIIAQVSYGAAIYEFGDYERAEELLLEARGYLETLGFDTYLFDCETTLSKLYRDWQPPHGKVLAVKHAQSARCCAERLRDPGSTVEGLCLLAEAELFAGQMDAAVRHHTEAQAGLGDLELPLIRFSVQAAGARLLYALGRTTEADGALREVESEAKRLGLSLDAHLHGLERDRLLNDVASATARLEWFIAHELKNGANLVLRAFPQLAPEPSPRAETGWALLEILGPMRFSTGGEARPVRGQQRKGLLALLTETRLAGRGEANTLDLCDALYPQESEVEALRCLKQLVFQVRTTLGHTLITTTPRGYALGQARTDAERFLESGDTTLWRGLYLEDADCRDETVRDALYRALKARLPELLKGDPTEGVRSGRLLLAAEPYDLEALALTLWTLQRAGDAKGLERCYRRSCASLLEVGVTLPNDAAAFLAAKPPGYITAI